MAFKMKMKGYGNGKNPIEGKTPPPTKFLKGLGQKIKGGMTKGGAGAVIGGLLGGPLGAAAGAAIQRRRNKKKAERAAAGGEGANPNMEALKAAGGFPGLAAQQAGGTPKVDPAAAAAGADPAAAAAAPVDPAMDPAAAPMAKLGRKPKGKMTKKSYPANKPKRK